MSEFETKRLELIKAGEAELNTMKEQLETLRKERISLISEKAEHDRKWRIADASKCQARLVEISHLIPQIENAVKAKDERLKLIRQGSAPELAVYNRSSKLKAEEVRQKAMEEAQAALLDYLTPDVKNAFQALLEASNRNHAERVLHEALGLEKARNAA